MSFAIRRWPPVARRRLGAVRLLGVAALLLAAAAGRASAQYDPKLRFHSIETPHFVIHHPREHDALARELAVIVEDVHDELVARMSRQGRGRTHVILVDQDDVPGGWATPVPYNLIEISAAGPTGSSFIGHTSDWLRLVFTHEYAHVLHLDRSRGWARAARAVFGRVPFAFPNLTLPLWHIEGLATLEESHDGEGRLHARDFGAIVREAAREGRFQPLDRAGGGLVDWPGGHAPYAYGARFHAFLAERYGIERVRELADRTAGRAPYVMAGAFRSVFGRRLGELWEEFSEAERVRLAPTASTGARLQRLTHTGHTLEGPRFDRQGGIVYSRNDPHDWPAIERLPADGRVPQRLAIRIGGEQLGVADDALYFDALERHRNAALRGDVYRLDLPAGRVVRLTSEARLADVDVSPDGQRLAMVRLAPNRRDLLVVPREELDRRPTAAELEALVDRGLLTKSRPEAFYSRPRWSPDGRLLAAESRGAAGGVVNVVIIDVERGSEVVVAPAAGRSVTPAWTPDGRSLLFASDREGEAFHLYRGWLGEDLSTTRLERLATLPGGTHSPDVSPDGRTVVFAGYTADGFDLFAMALEPDIGMAELKFGPTRAPPSTERSPVGPNFSSAINPSSAMPRPYSPWPAVLPRAWLPILDIQDHHVEIGAVTGGVDPLRYHAWAAVATWPVARDTRFRPLADETRPNLLVSYAYNRWRPTLFAQVEDDTEWLLAGRGTEAEQPVSIRDRSATFGVVLPVRRVRSAQTWTAAWRIEDRTIDLEPGSSRQRRGAARLGWGLSTATRHGYSISVEGGVLAGAAVELSRQALGADHEATFSRADVRGYLRVWPRHGVLAARASGATASGDVRGRRRARLGGIRGDASVPSLAEDASSLLRGFPSNTFFGDHVALVNAEYRVPLAWPQRGIRDWPVFLRALHATVFADMGHVWDASFDLSDVKRSWGAELSGDFTLGYALPLTVTAGVGWGRDGAGLVPDNRQLYVRLGHGF